MKNKIVLGVILCLSLFLTATPVLIGKASTAIIWTDKADYTPGETVTVTGSGFIPYNYYDIPVIRPDGNIVLGDGSDTAGWDTIQADASGYFDYYYQLNGVAGLYEVRVYDSPWSGSLDQEALAITTFTDAAPAANLDQVRNGAGNDPVDPGDWVNGNAGEQNAHYLEGWSIPYRVVMTDLPTETSITLTLGYDIKHSDRHALDYLTHYYRLDPYHNDFFGHDPEVINPLLDVTGVSVSVTTYDIPAPSSTSSPVSGQPTDSFNDLTEGERVMTLYGGTITNIAYDVQGDLTASNAETRINVTFTVDSSTAVLAWGGHIASREDWEYDEDGVPMSAGGISGSPYHMRLIDWTLNNLGNQDRSLAAAAVYIPPGTIIVHKTTNPSGDTQEFEFTSSTLSPSQFYLSDGELETFSDLVQGTYDVAEVVPPGWDLTDFYCDDGSDPGAIGLDPGETVNVYFENTQRGKIIVDKVTDPTGSSQSFDFTTDAGSPFSLTDTDTPWDSGWILPGTYYVSETVPVGWDLTSAVCSDGSPVAAIVVSPGETVTATFTNMQLFEFLKQFTGSGALSGTAPMGPFPGTTSTINEIKTGPTIWWEVTYSVTNEDSEGHYYTLWDKWGGNLLILGGYPTLYDPGSTKKAAGFLTLNNAPPFKIDYHGYSEYLDNYGDITDNINYAATHFDSPTDGAWMSLHTGDQQEDTNPGKGKKNQNDGKSYDADIAWKIGWLEPGESATLTIYLAPGINPGGVLQFSSYGEYVVNTGPRVRAYLDLDQDGNPYENNEFIYSWDFTNQLIIIAEKD